MNEPRHVKVTDYGMRVAYPVASDPEALVLFADFDARHACDRYTLFGSDRQQIFYLRIPKIEFELNPIYRRALAK